jgi:hypothetical protein
MSSRRVAAIVVAAAATSAIVVSSTAFAQAVVEVTTIPGADWLSRPGDTLGAGTLRLVEGPATPARGRGSLELGVTAPADRALLTQSFGAAIPPARVLTDLTGSFSTWVAAGPDPGAAAPTLRFEAFLDVNNPAGNFTTINVEASRQTAQGPVVAETWQTWSLDQDSIVWQTNAASTCVQATPCTLAALVAAFPDAAWGTVQVGLGSGIGTPAVSYVDAIDVSAGGESFAWDFELPADQRSSAAIGAVTPTATGGTVPVTLTASALAVDATTFAVTAGGVTQEFTLQPGESQVVELTVPFGTTSVAVASRGSEIAAEDVVVTQATTTTAPATTAPSTTAPTGPGQATTPGPTLPATGRATGELSVLGIALVAFGAAALGLAGALVRRRVGTDAG